MSTENDAAFPNQPPQDLAIFLGGSSKKHSYLRTHFEKYSTTPIECTNLYTKRCHKYGHQKYSSHFKRIHKRVVAVCPLMDSLIPFTDSMNTEWGLPHNDTTTSQIRRNKALMHQTIRNNTDNKIRNAPLFVIDDYLTNKQAFETKMKQQSLSYPIVIKPLTSGGTDGVRLCYTFEAAQRVVKRNLHQTNGEGHENTSMMAQEFLDGEEYVINSVSHDTNHRFTDVWRAYKSFHVDKTKAKDDDDEEEQDEKEKESDEIYPYSILYDYQEFEREIVKNEKMQLIVSYVENVLNILGVKYGCSHCEVMYLPKENKVCLIELNARMHGDLPRATSLVGYDQLTILAMKHCDSQRFLNEIPKCYDLKENDENNEEDPVSVRAIFLRSKVDGKMDMNRLISLEGLKTFKSFARTLYNGVQYWLKYKEQARVCLEKLDENNADESNVNENENETDAVSKTNYLETLTESLEYIDRVESVEKTIDLLSCPGTIVLEGKRSDIKKDYNTIRALEDDLEHGLFVV
eukprot:69184_1